MSLKMKRDLMLHIKSVATLTALIGSGASFRCYPVEAPQGTGGSHLVYHNISSREAINHGGPSGYTFDVLQFDCVANSPIELESLADALSDALNGYSGTSGTTHFAISQLTNRVDDNDPQLKIYRTICDYQIEHYQI